MGFTRNVSIDALADMRTPPSLLLAHGCTQTECCRRRRAERAERAERRRSTITCSGDAARRPQAKKGDHVLGMSPCCAATERVNSPAAPTLDEHPCMLRCQNTEYQRANTMVAATTLIKILLLINIAVRIVTITAVNLRRLLLSYFRSSLQP